MTELSESVCFSSICIMYRSLYVIQDLFSRYVVGWRVSRKENAGLAKHLVNRMIAKHRVAPVSLILDEDRGKPVIAHTLKALGKG